MRIFATWFAQLPHQRQAGASRRGFVEGMLAMGLLSFTLGLVGCDAQKIKELEEGVATEADVRARFGEPEKVWEPNDLTRLPLPAASLELLTTPGSRTFEYNRQPGGNVNYMITIGPDGKMSALRQVLSPQNFGRILPGQSMEQVRKLLGKPMKITPYALQQTIHYDWRYLNPPSTNRIFTVVFSNDLRVVSTGSVDEEVNQPGGGVR
jgi:hypothetical protein